MIDYVVDEGATVLVCCIRCEHRVVRGTRMLAVREMDAHILAAHARGNIALTERVRVRSSRRATDKAQ